jgi:glutaredoxin 3
MKLIGFVASLFCVVNANLFNIEVSERLTGDFLVGFEAGIMVLEKTHKNIQNDCPDKLVGSKTFENFSQMLKTIKLLSKNFNGAGSNQLIIDSMIESLDIFCGKLDGIMGVFDKEYPGSDYCAGHTFGMHGATMLEKIATVLYEKHIKYNAVEARSHTLP